MISSTFQTIGLIGKRHNLGCIETLQAVLSFLEQYELAIHLDKMTADMMALSHYPTHSLAELSAISDLVIVVGGDGMMLQAAAELIAHDTPVIGINRGHLGFLTDIHPTEIQGKLAPVLQGYYQEELRFLLNTTIHHQGQAVKAGVALNDVVLSPAGSIHMTQFEIEIDGEFVCRQRADGVIVTTPTGSTAYALSGGGPIIFPSLDVIAVVPMFPHILSSRPIVVSSLSTINIHILAENANSPKLSCDGRDPILIAKESTLVIKRHDKMLRLIHPNKYRYFETLRAKLGWGTRV